MRWTVAGACGQPLPHARRVLPGTPELPRTQAGLTIVELVLVIVIIGVLGALAGPRFFNDRSFGERAYAEELAAALRYAQKVAVGSGCRVRVSVAATSYSLAQQAPQSGHCNSADGTYPVPVVLPDGSMVAGTAPSGVSAAPAVVVTYDALGRVSSASGLAITVGTQTLTIAAGSGLVQGP
ncbi:MAG: type II secretion system protein [Woeseiaceae bacterium]|nr:type II secretion system protein [Woeseiaceae bacterium]